MGTWIPGWNRGARHAGSLLPRTFPVPRSAGLARSPMRWTACGRQGRAATGAAAAWQAQRGVPAERVLIFEGISPLDRPDGVSDALMRRCLTVKGWEDACDDANLRRCGFGTYVFVGTWKSPVAICSARAEIRELEESGLRIAGEFETAALRRILAAAGYESSAGAVFYAIPVKSLKPSIRRED